MDLYIYIFIYILYIYINKILEWGPIPSPGGLPNPGIELGSPASQVNSLPPELLQKSYIYILRHNRILISHKKNEILYFMTTWMDLEGIILSELSQIEKTNTM